MKSTINLFEVFCQMANRQPDHPAFVDRTIENVCSYRTLRDRIEHAAAKLKDVGVCPGMCVGLHCGSGLEYVVWAYAIWKCGGVIVPIAVELVGEEKAAICAAIHLGGVISTNKDRNCFEEFQNGPESPLQERLTWIPIGQVTENPPRFTKINAAFIRFTSGTTAASKGVVLSHETVYERIHAANEALQVGSHDRILWLLSMSYHFTVSIVSYLTFGATVILPNDHFGRTIVQAAKGATFIYGSPVHYHLMAHDRSEVTLPDLRLVISTASSLNEATAEAFYRRFNIPLSQAYGIIEIGLPCINLDRQREKRGSVGRPLSAFEIKTSDVGLGDDLQAISIKGKGIIDAYYHPWKPRKKIMPDGWFATGDLGKVDDDGYLHILGRSKEMISVAGMKVFPQEVEAILESHPGIKEACVFGHEHERMGEVPYARVVLAEDQSLAPSEEDLRKHCQSHLTTFKIPEKIDFVEELPRTASGKLLRRPIRLPR
jgi:long-chain acyl-CoA synthetase